ncbi:MAG: cation:proton antiporter, partial [Candidatus Diapherotrites archaeon]
MDLTLLFDLGVVLIFATICGCIARLFKQPLLIAYVFAGMLIGPLGLSLVTGRMEISILAELGVAFLLFMVGIQSDFKQLLKLKKIIFIGSLSQVVATTVITVFLVRFFGIGFIESVYLGLILAFSSTALVVKQLSSMNLVSTLHGRIIIGFALVQDAVAVFLLPVLADPKMLFSLSLVLDFLLGFSAIVLLAMVLNWLVLPKLLSKFSDSSELFYLILVSCCFGFILLSNLLNFSLVVGAFIGGLTLS